MSKKPISVAENETFEADETGAPISNDMEVIENELLSEFDNDAGDIWKVFVYRAGTNGKNGPRLFECSIADLPIIPRVRADYGSGDYVVNIYRNGRLFRRSTFALEVPKKAEPQNDPQIGAIAAALNNQARMIENLVNRLATPPAPPPPQNTLMDTVQLFTQLAGVLKQIAPPPVAALENKIGPKDLMDMFSRGLEVARELGGGSEKGESNMIDLIRDVVKSPIVESVLKAQQMAPRQMPLPFPPTKPMNPPVMVPQSPQPAPGMMPQSPQPAPGISDENMVQIAGFVNMLVGAAKRQADVSIYADMVADNLEDDLIKSIIDAPNLQERLAAINPEIVPNWPWFELLLADLREMFTQDIVPPNENISDIQPHSSDFDGNPDG